jgi:hypothetical protein
MTLDGSVVLSDLGLDQRDNLGVHKFLGCIEGMTTARMTG